VQVTPFTANAKDGIIAINTSQHVKIKRICILVSPKKLLRLSECEPLSLRATRRIKRRTRGKIWGSRSAMVRSSGYFFTPEPLPDFEAAVCPAAGFGFSALGFFGSRLLLFWPLAMIASWVGI
jgi:hypothetical protein